MEEEKERELCIVKDKRYDFYWIGKANYVSDVNEAILNYNDIPYEIKEDLKLKDSKLEILFLDSKEGLEHFTKEGGSPKGLKTAIFSLFQT
jgi:hypothetical protein